MVRLDGKCLLDRKRLSNTRGNPSVDTIEELFAGFGFDSVVDDLSIKDFQIESTYIEENQSTSIESKIASALGANQQGALQEVLRVVDEKWKPKKRRRDVGYVSAIQELLKQRNRIAHGEGREPVTPQELKDHCAVIRQFGAGLNQLIDAMIDGLRARACASDETAAF
jgi:hypothetical protein